MPDEQSSNPELIDLLRLPKVGRMYDLSTGWWRHMPTFAGNPQFEVVTYNSPQGERAEGRAPFNDASHNDAQWGYVSELVTLGLHTGTHIDALSHVTAGPNDEWHGGISAAESVGNYGPLRDDASQFPPLVGRGVLFDIPGLLGVDYLPAHFAIEDTHLQAIVEQNGIELRAGDIALIRTGQMKFWPDMDAVTAHCEGSGVDVSGAAWLADHKVGYVGADTQSFEVRPSNVAGNSLPVHVLLVHDRGLNIIEWINCEEIAAAGVTEFLFIALPLTIRGGTASPIRPLAIV